jgi:ABC-2 type transport system permease protein
MRTLVRKELREQWRTNRFFIVTGVLFVFGLLGPLSVKYMPLILTRLPGVPEGLAEVMPSPDVAMAVDEYLQNLTQIGVILAILVPMAAVVGEKSRGTAAMVLSKPVSRAAFLGAKYIAYELVFIVGILFAGVGGYFYIGILFERLPLAGFLALNLFIVIYLTVFLAITLLASTISRSQLAAAGIAFGFMIALGLLGTIPSLMSYLPSSFMAWGRELALGLEAEPAWEALSIALAIAPLAWLLAWISFQRQEI